MIDFILWMVGLADSVIQQSGPRPQLPGTGGGTPTPPTTPTSS